MAINTLNNSNNIPVSLNNLVDNKTIDDMFILDKPDALKNLSNLVIIIGGKQINFFQIIRGIDTTNISGNNLDFEVNGQRYQVKAGDNLIKLIQASVYLIGESTVQFKNGPSIRSQIDGSFGQATAKGVITLKTKLELQEEFIESSLAGAEVTTIKTKPNLDRKKERDSNLEYKKEDNFLKVNSYGQESLIRLDDSKIFFIFNGQQLEIPYNLVLLKNKNGKINDFDEKNKINIQEAIRFINSIHLIFKDFIILDKKPKNKEPFYDGVNIPKALNPLNIDKKSLYFNDGIIFDTIVLDRNFFDEHTNGSVINRKELAKFLNNLYSLVNPNIVNNPTTTIKTSVRNNPTNTTITTKP